MSADHEDPGATPDAPKGAEATAPRGQLSRFLWSMASFASSYGLRFLSNIVLTRLLAPEVFGIMVVVTAMRLGVELLTDVGIEQNIVRHKEGLEPRFFNTAWTMQIIRGCGLSVLFLAASPLLASFYDIDVRIFMAIAFAPLLNSLHSTSIFALVKKLEVKKRTLFEFRAEFIGFVATIGLALVTPTAWAMVFGTLIAISARSLLSYRLPHPSHRLMLDGKHAREIIVFGRWIMISSLVIFAAGNLDRLTLGKIAPLALLGIYGLARTMADIPPMMARRLVYQIIFPTLSAAQARGETDMKANLRPVRKKLVLIAAIIIGLGIGCADWAITILYDARYAEAGWMLSLLLVASWLSILSNLNEGLLMGSGKPSYESGANLVRLGVLASTLWLGYSFAGFAGAIGALVLGELGRYLFIQAGQLRMRLSFIGQDAIGTLVLVAVVGCWLVLRMSLGLDSPWDGMIAAR